MELILDNGNATYHIQRYENHSIIVNNHTYAHPLCVMPNHLIAPWGSFSLSFHSLHWDHFSIILPYKPQVILLGTGEQHRFLDPYLINQITAARVGLEVMNTAAACRTYTLLMAEGRSVAACLFC